MVLIMTLNKYITSDDTDIMFETFPHLLHFKTQTLLKYIFNKC